MLNRLTRFLSILGVTYGFFGCGGSIGKATCASPADAGRGDMGSGPEARPCRVDDDFHLWLTGHMSADRSITFGSLTIDKGWLGGVDSWGMIGRLLAEDGTVLKERIDSDFMLCMGKHCPPYPRAVDFDVGIQMVSGAAFYELTDTISGKPPIRIDLRGHVQLFCMNAPCALDVCKPLLLDAGSTDVPARDSGLSAGADVGPEGGLPE